MSELNEEARNLRDVITRLWWKCEGLFEKMNERLKAPVSENGTPPPVNSSTRCTDNSVSGRDSSHVNYNRIDLGERTWVVIAVALASLAIGLAILAIVLAQLAERETKLAREDIRVMSIALAHHGINTDEHATEKGDRK